MIVEDIFSDITGMELQCPDPGCTFREKGSRCTKTEKMKHEGTPRCEIRVAKDCQNRPNLKVFFKASKWMDMLCPSMTTIASTFVLQKKSFNSFFR